MSTFTFDPSKLVTATIVVQQNRDDTNSSLGLGLRCEERGRLVVYEISDGSPFNATPLRMGMRVWSINNTAVKTLDLAVYILKQAKGTITILASSDDGQHATRRSKSSLAMASSNSLLDSHNDNDSDDDEGAFRISVTEASTQEEARLLLQPLPPHGCPSGGIWGTHRFVGHTTMVNAALDSLVFSECVGVCGALCFPEDEEPAYRVDGYVYGADGSCIGSALFTKFHPVRVIADFHYDDDNNKTQTHWSLVQY